MAKKSSKRSSAKKKSSTKQASSNQKHAVGSCGSSCPKCINGCGLDSQHNGPHQCDGGHRW